MNNQTVLISLDGRPLVVVSGVPGVFLMSEVLDWYAYTHSFERRSLTGRLMETVECEAFSYVGVGK